MKFANAPRLIANAGSWQDQNRDSQFDTRTAPGQASQQTTPAPLAHIAFPRAAVESPEFGVAVHGDNERSEPRRRGTPEEQPFPEREGLVTNLVFTPGMILPLLRISNPRNEPRGWRV